MTLPGLETRSPTTITFRKIVRESPNLSGSIRLKSVGSDTGKIPEAAESIVVIEGETDTLSATAGRAPLDANAAAPA